MSDALARFFALADRLNARTGGRPVERERAVGTLPVPSGRLALGDPQSPTEVVVPGAAGDAAVSVRTLRYPDGGLIVAAATVAFPEADAGPHDRGARRTESLTVGIDSAKLVIADADAIEDHWGDGPERIGLISSSLDPDIVAELKAKFGLKTRPPELFHTRVVGPVPEELRKAVLDYLGTMPDRVPLPFLQFTVETRGSFDRANRFDRPWGLLPVGNVPRPRMAVCETGRGDGRYPVRIERRGAAVRRVTVAFLEPAPVAGADETG